METELLKLSLAFRGLSDEDEEETLDDDVELNDEDDDLDDEDDASKPSDADDGLGDDGLAMEE